MAYRVSGSMFPYLFVIITALAICYAISCYQAQLEVGEQEYKELASVGAAQVYQPLRPKLIHAMQDNKITWGEYRALISDVAIIDQKAKLAVKQHSKESYKTELQTLVALESAKIPNQKMSKR